MLSVIFHGISVWAVKREMSVLLKLLKLAQVLIDYCLLIIAY